MGLNNHWLLIEGYWNSHSFLAIAIKFLWVRENIVLTFGPDKIKRFVSIATDSSNWVIMGEMF